MATAYRSHNSTAWGGGHTNTTTTAPTGITNDDNLVLMHAIGAAGARPTPTMPTGFTVLTGYPITITDGGFLVDIRLAHKVAASESGDYTTTHSSASSSQIVVCSSGGSASTPTATTNNGTGTTSTATGQTTGANDAFVLYFGFDYDGNTALTTVPAGTTPTFTERVDTNNQYCATGTWASSGATGNKTQTNGNGGAAPWWAGLVVIEVAGAAAGQPITKRVGGVTFAGSRAPGSGVKYWRACPPAGWRDDGGVLAPTPHQFAE